jgi:hypothetical protein
MAGKSRWRGIWIGLVVAASCARPLRSYRAPSTPPGAGQCFASCVSRRAELDDRWSSLSFANCLRSCPAVRAGREPCHSGEALCAEEGDRPERVEPAFPERLRATVSAALGTMHVKRQSAYFGFHGNVGGELRVLDRLAVALRFRYMEYRQSLGDSGFSVARGHSSAQGVVALRLYPLGFGERTGFYVGGALGAGAWGVCEGDQCAGGIFSGSIEAGVRVPFGKRNELHLGVDVIHVPTVRLHGAGWVLTAQAGLAF